MTKKKKQVEDTIPKASMSEWTQWAAGESTDSFFKDLYEDGEIVVHSGAQ